MDAKSLVIAALANWTGREPWLLTTAMVLKLDVLADYSILRADCRLRKAGPSFFIPQWISAKRAQS